MPDETTGIFSQFCDKGKKVKVFPLLNQTLIYLHINILLIQSLLAAFAKLRKAILASSCLSVSLSGRMEQLCSHWKEFHETLYITILLKSVEKIQVSLKYVKNNGTLHEDLSIFMIISRWILLRMRNVSGKIVEIVKIHILCSITFFRKSCCLWDNVVKYGKAGQATDDKAHAHCWITKAINTQS
jgi:hypothetical protein